MDLEEEPAMAVVDEVQVCAGTLDSAERGPRLPVRPAVTGRKNRDCRGRSGDNAGNPRPLAVEEMGGRLIAGLRLSAGGHDVHPLLVSGCDGLQVNTDIDRSEDSGVRAVVVMVCIIG